MPAYVKKSGPIKLVFVVPDDIYDDFKYQNIVIRDRDSKNLRTVKNQDARLKGMQQWVLRELS